MRKILYVDDEEINLRLFELSFRNEFEVITATSARQGLELLDSHPEMKLVISDLKMPEMDGLQFIKLVKQREGNYICLLLTGFIESDVILEGFNRELIFRYLTKPWKKAELLENINEAFQRLV